MKLLPLYGKHGLGLFSKVSDEDFDEVSKYKWFVHLNSNDKSYKTARRHTGNIRTGTFRQFHLHRVIAGDKEGLVVDHIDRDPLNNTRENLRHVTQYENLLNSRRVKPGIHKKGTTRRKNGKWQAVYKEKHIGMFETVDEAHEAFLKYERNLCHTPHQTQGEE